VNAIVLAGGRGLRMGGPKALLCVDGSPLVVQHVRRLREARCDRIVVVVPSGARAKVVVDAVVLARDTPSQAHSLVEAVRALGPCDRVLVTPVDFTPARIETLNALAARDGQVVVPRYHGRRGHPVLVRRNVLRGYERGEARPLREVLAGARVLEVDIDDPAVLRDYDTPADLP
jgi:molybdenum cofactor cytidylyltransferase